MEAVRKWQERTRVLNWCMHHARFAYSLLETGRHSRDPVFLEQFQWTHGQLPRLPLESIVPASSVADLTLIRPLDRVRDTSVSLYELCCLLAIAKHVRARRILEIGTWDGNTALNLAANTEADVATLDLPPDFDAMREPEGAPAGRVNNMTARGLLGRQLREHPAGSRVRQFFGDSTAADWKSFGPAFDLIFIDACHKYSFVRSDSENACAHLSPGGAVVWHDYGIFRDVSRAVDEIAAAGRLTVHAIEGTRLAVGFAAR